MNPFPRALRQLPIAHRALHDTAAGRPENSRAAIRAAIEAGYAIEIDLQLSRDGRAMVFHDYDLRRLTGETGPVRRRTANDLGRIALAGTEEGIPTLAEVLALVDSAVPLLIELKDQAGGLGPDVGPLEEAAARDLAGYDGVAALMSFNPHSVARLAQCAPDVPRGLTTCAFKAENWPLLRRATRRRLREIPDYNATGACFISHDANDLARPRVAALKQAGAAVLCWTVRSPKAEARARKLADNVTFEGYLPDLPA
ncbi:glycerophosphodiester phosphodiesterase family protein [Roseovarius salinarum]|uniref:glycerophosphodiester phosphodiesterase family protein n=1 Tax=Roseovarius salinarum TaxID=1981892 RepID=UPI000C326EC9|nr:glycerophosphodiester phosphodiesterase family protein [Roseovarius salinarum]